MPETKPKLVAFLGRPVRYISIVPGHASATAFICGFGGTEEDRRVDLLVMDEKKKNLLNTMNWPMAFSRVHDVPHLDAPPEQRTKHCFDFMYAEEGDDFDPWKKKKVFQMQSPKPLPDGETTTGTVDYPELRKQLNDYESTFYGPHPCAVCGRTIMRQAIEQGAAEYEERDPNLGPPQYQPHVHAESKPSGADLDKAAEDEKAKAATAGGAPAPTSS